MRKLESESETIKKKFKQEKAVEEFVKNYVANQITLQKVHYHLEKLQKAQYQYAS